MLVTPLLQGAYFVATGVWPIVHFPSFERVTGPKFDAWLVKTLAGVLTVTGGVLLYAARSRRPSDSVRVLGVATAGALAASDVIYVAERQIPPVYLLDAAAEAAFIAGWLFEPSKH